MHMLFHTSNQDLVFKVPMYDKGGLGICQNEVIMNVGYC